MVVPSGDRVEVARVRRAGPNDAAGLAALGERAFREAWGGHNDPADMDAYCAAHFTVPALAADLARDTVTYWVAEALAQAVGYLRTEQGTAPDCVQGGSPIEIARVYVLRAWHGRGTAHVLMSRALEWAAAAGHDVAWLAVWQQAAQPQRFYRKWGFGTVGTATFRLGRDVQDDFVMQRPLSAGVPGASGSR